MSRALRAELQALKSEYSARVDALEARIQQLEAANAAAADATLAAARPHPPRRQNRAPGAPGGSASAFNPAISLILGGSYTSTLARSGGLEHGAASRRAGGEVGPGERSFNLGESELTFSASIDPYFSGQLTAAITGENEIEVEEAFVRTTALPDGFTARCGRFFSGFGYLNEVHAHAWDFVDQPLVYQAMFGGQFRQNGVQVKWLAPTDLFLEFGAETGNGDGFPATRLERQRLQWRDLVRACRRRRRRLHQLARRRRLAHAKSRSIAKAASQTRPASRCSIPSRGDARHLGGRRRAQVGAVAAAAAQGAGRVHAPPRERRDRGRRRRCCSPTTTATRNPAGTCRACINSRRAGAWALRYDSLDSGTPRYAFAPDGLLDASPDRVSLMLDWNPERVLAPACPVRLGQRARRRPWSQRWGSHRAPAIHLRHRRARRAQVLGIPSHEESHPIVCNVVSGRHEPAGQRRAQGAGHHARLGRVDAGARRRAGQRVRRHHRDAGRASRRGQAQSRGACPQRGSGGRHRRRARGGLVAGADPGVRQCAHPAGRGGLLRSGAGAAIAGGALEARPLHGRHPSAGQSARAARSAQHPGRRACADARGSRSSIPRRRRSTRRAAKDFDARWDAAIKRWESRAAPLKGAPVVVMHRDQAYLCHWLGLVEVASIEPKPGVPPTAAYLGAAGRQANYHAGRS